MSPQILMKPGHVALFCSIQMVVKMVLVFLTNSVPGKLPKNDGNRSRAVTMDSCYICEVPAVENRKVDFTSNKLLLRASYTM